jgi:hypothetical protein
MPINKGGAQHNHYQKRKQTPITSSWTPIKCTCIITSESRWKSKTIMYDLSSKVILVNLNETFCKKNI